MRKGRELEKTHVYQAFYFDNQVKQHFYTGNSFLGYKENMNHEQLLELAYDILEEGDGIMPELTRKIEELHGEGNYESDYWEFGPDAFSLY